RHTAGQIRKGPPSFCGARQTDCGARQTDCGARQTEGRYPACTVSATTAQGSSSENASAYVSAQPKNGGAAEGRSKEKVTPPKIHQRESRSIGGSARAIGTKQTFRDVCYSSASGGKADISQRWRTIVDYDGSRKFKRKRKRLCQRTAKE